MAHPLDLDSVRGQFPALKRGFAFGDNAGGSQILQGSIDRMVDYLVNTNSQMGSDYLIASTNRCMTDAQQATRHMFNAASPDEIVFGASSTQNLENLARGLEGSVEEGEEIILTGEHEANASPWKGLAKRKGATVKVWPWAKVGEGEFALGLRVEEVLPLITARTRLVAFTACSNILGSILPVGSIVSAIRKAHAAAGGTGPLEISLDCVAYAPHHRIDVQSWDVDFCVFSYYKVYGPHVSAMYVRKASLQSTVGSIVHHFLSPSVDSNGYKLQPAGPGYESVWATTAVPEYIKSLTPEGTLEAGYEAMAGHDVDIAAHILEHLTSPRCVERGVRVVGTGLASDRTRMPTVSFLVLQGAKGEPAIKSRDLVLEMDKSGTVGIRYGHFYAYTLISSLSEYTDATNGIVRASFVHYNTRQEIEEFLKLLDKILFPEE